MLSKQIAFFAAVFLSTAVIFAAEQITTTATNEVWDTNHIVFVDGKLIYLEEGPGAGDETVMFYDGVTSTPIQSADAGDPALDLVAKFVFGLGTGASTGEVIGAWRRGADYAWVWTSGQTPVQIDTFAANVNDPSKPTNAESVAIADGCVFMTLQANDGGFTVIRVFQIDTVTGQPQLVSTPASEAGPGRVVSSQCRAAWVHDPNTDLTGNSLPAELQYFDGTQTQTIDSGTLLPRDLAMGGDVLVYIKKIAGAYQVLRKDLADPMAPPQVLSSTDLPKRSPVTDGFHVAWGEEHLIPEGDSREIVLHGGLRLSDQKRTRSQTSVNAFVLDSGQLSLRNDYGLFQEQIWHWAGNQWNLVDRSPAEDDPGVPQLSNGRIAFHAPPAAGQNDDVIMSDAIPPLTFSVIPPPMAVLAEFGVGRARVHFSEVIGADSYNIYYAQDPSVSPQNYDSLPGGGLLSTTDNVVVIDNLPLGVHYHFVVTSVAGGDESPASGTASTRGFLVDSTADEPDVDTDNGLCATASGACTLRAAVQQVSALGTGETVAVPIGTYVLTQPVVGTDTSREGDLDIYSGPVTIVGEDRDQTIVDANGFDFGFDVHNQSRRGTVVIRSLTVQGAQKVGLRAAGGSVHLDDVRIRDNGPFDRGGAAEHNSEWMIFTDSIAENNQAGSHGAAFMLNSGSGALEIYRSQIVNNTAILGGGVVYSQSTEHVSIHDSVIDGNSSTSSGWGGGVIVSERRADIHISGSQISNNFGNGCGGVLQINQGDVFVHNTTMSNNSSLNGGGAICASGSGSDPPRIHIYQSTLTGNSCSDCGSGLGGSTLASGGDATFELSHTILDVGPGESNCSAPIALTSEGFNLETGDTCGFGGLDHINTDPLLSTLGDYGGPTQVHVPGAGSLALDGGATTCSDSSSVNVLVDQRGAARPFDHDGDSTPRCDIGAVEDLGPCVDGDSDGFNGPLGDLRCTLPAFGGGDCDDSSATVYPLAAQVCDGVNNDCSDPAWPGLEGTNEGDNDGDGFSICAGDCLDTNADAYAVPGEVVGLSFTDESVFAWSPPADPGGSVAGLVYDVHRGDSAIDLNLGGVCLDDSTANTSTSDGAIPTAGEVFHYLVRAENACPQGPGSWGDSSDGSPRVASACP